MIKNGIYKKWHEDRSRALRPSAIKEEVNVAFTRDARMPGECHIMTMAILSAKGKKPSGSLRTAKRFFAAPRRIEWPGEHRLMRAVRRQKKEFLCAWRNTAGDFSAPKAWAYDPMKRSKEIGYWKDCLKGSLEQTSQASACEAPMAARRAWWASEQMCCSLSSSCWRAR